MTDERRDGRPPADRWRRSLVYLVMISAVLLPASPALLGPPGPLLMGGGVVLVAWWGTAECISVADGVGLAAAGALVGPLLFVALNLAVFLFIYFYTATYVVVQGAGRLAPGGEVLDFLRSEFTKAARDDPELVQRARELHKAGFEEEEARRLALEEFHDPVLNPPAKGAGATRDGE